MKNMKLFLNFIVLLFFFIYFFFLFFRIFMQRIPVDIIFSLFLIFGFYISILFLPILTQPFIKKFNLKISWIEKFYNYLEMDFFQAFLDNKQPFIIFFYFITKKTSFFVNKNYLAIPYIFFYIPETLLILIFFYEIFFSSSNCFYLVFFFLSFSLSLKKLFSLCLYISMGKFLHLGQMSFDFYFPEYQKNFRKLFVENSSFAEFSILARPLIVEKSVLLKEYKGAYLVIFYHFQQLLMFLFDKIIFLRIEKAFLIFKVTLVGFCLLLKLSDIYLFSIFWSNLLIPFALISLTIIFFHFFFDNNWPLGRERIVYDKALFKLPSWKEDFDQHVLKDYTHFNLTKKDLIFPIPSSLELCAFQCCNEKGRFLLFCEFLISFKNNILKKIKKFF